MPVRPRRSMLYLPGSNARALDKARQLPADCLILDLEDAVAPSAKDLAREQLVAALEQGGYGNRELIVRTNVIGCDWATADLAALAACACPPDGILFPKISTAQALEQAVVAVDRAGCDPSIAIWVMAETPLSILNIDRIAAAHPRLKGIVVGTSDLAKDSRIRHTEQRLGFITALSLCVYAARAHGLDVIDGVHLALDDPSGLEAACVQGRDLGFDGKSLIHPKQLAVANRVFAPTTAELDHAREIIAEYRRAEAQGSGVVVVQGRLVEALHVEEAQRSLALHSAIATRDS